MILFAVECIMQRFIFIIASGILVYAIILAQTFTSYACKLFVNEKKQQNIQELNFKYSLLGVVAILSGS